MIDRKEFVNMVFTQLKMALGEARKMAIMSKAESQFNELLESFKIKEESKKVN